jgi:hypothetical protein
LLAGISPGARRRSGSIPEIRRQSFFAPLPILCHRPKGANRLVVEHRLMNMAEAVLDAGRDIAGELPPAFLAPLEFLRSSHGGIY